MYKLTDTFCLQNDFCCFRSSAYTTLNKMVTVLINTRHIISLALSLKFRKKWPLKSPEIAVFDNPTLTVFTSTRPSHQLSSATLLMYAGRRDPRIPVRRSVELVSDIPVVVADRSSSHSAVRVSSTSPLPAARRRSQRLALVRIRCTRPPSAITVSQWNARSVGNKSVVINDLIGRGTT